MTISPTPSILTTVEVLLHDDVFVVFLFQELGTENLHHLYALSRRVLRQYGYRADLKYTNLVEPDDLINQAYIDLRSGKVLFDYTRRSISRGLWRSMYYAPVGGAPEDYIYHYKARGGSGTGTRRRRKFAPA